MERAILFFDIDGTVLSEVTKEVPQSAIEAMEKARAEGHLLFINTGRTICSIPTEVRKFQFDGYLCGCGTYLTEHDEVLLKSSIEKQRGIELLRKAKECNLGVIAEGQEDCYFPGHISRFDRLESTRRYFASRGIGIEQSLESERFEYDKLFVYVDDKSDFDSFREYLGDDMEEIPAENYIEEMRKKRAERKGGRSGRRDDRRGDDDRREGKGRRRRQTDEDVLDMMREHRPGKRKSDKAFDKKSDKKSDKKFEKKGSDRKRSDKSENKSKGLFGKERTFKKNDIDKKTGKAKKWK